MGKHKEHINRGIAYHAIPTTQDICEALINLEVDVDDFQIVTFDDVIGECIKMYKRAKGYIKDDPAIKALKKEYEKTPRSRFLKGAKIYENVRSRVAVPIAETASPILNGEIMGMGEYEREKAINVVLPYSKSPAIGHAFFIKDCKHPVMIRWLELRSGQVIGNQEQLIIQLADASSNPNIKKLQEMGAEYNKATYKALPKP